MRRLAVPALLAASLGLAACGDPCKDLGNRLCGCQAAGLATTNCEQQYSNQIDQASNFENKAICTARLSTCNAPKDTLICEWVLTRCGRASCGLSAEDPTAPGVCPAPAP